MLVAGLTLASILGAHGEKGPSTRIPSKLIQTKSGLKYKDLLEGTGPSPKVGQACVVEYKGWLARGSRKGKPFVDSRERGYPAEFPFGVGRVIPGWDEGLATMKAGGRRLLVVPPALGYSAREAGTDIPPGSTLIFELELVALR
jgi:peptidylprolyl isomerase